MAPISPHMLLGNPESLLAFLGHSALLNENRTLIGCIVDDTFHSEDRPVQENDFEAKKIIIWDKKRFRPCRGCVEWALKRFAHSWSARHVHQVRSLPYERHNGT